MTDNAKLLHIYTMGRFGPEKLLGFVWARINAIPFRDTSSYLGWDVVKNTDIPTEFYTNPFSLNGADYRSWRRKKGAR